jgi:hypothetical protein
MDQLWGVLGRACVDPGFFGAVVSKVVEKHVGGMLEPEDDFGKLSTFQDVLTFYRFRPSRYETAELNRIFFVLKYWRGQSPAEYLSSEWVKINSPIPNAQEMWRLLGLCCVDPSFAKRYFQDPENVDLLASQPPVFTLNASEIAALKNFFRRADFQQWLLRLNEFSWIPPNPVVLKAFLQSASEELGRLAEDGFEQLASAKTQCSPAFEKDVERLVFSYRHPAPVLVELLTTAIAFPAALPPGLDFERKWS